MPNLLTKWIQLCLRFKFIFLSGLCISLILSVLFLNENFSSDASLEKTLPVSDLTESFNILLAINKPDEQIFFKFEGEDVINKVAAIQQYLANQKAIDTFSIQITNPDFDIENYLNNNAPIILNQSDYSTLDSLFSNNTFSSFLKQNNKELYKGLSSIRSYKLFQDPFHVENILFKSLAKNQSKQWHFEDGYLLYADSSGLFVRAHLDPQRTVPERIKLLENDIAQNQFLLDSAELKVIYFTPSEIHKANSTQIQKDTRFTMFISIGLILLILLIAYRNIWTPLYFVLPALIAGTYGLSVYFLILPEISMLSLGSASVILGIVLDYSFHFFTHYKHSKDVLETVKSTAIPMIVGGFTTCIALLGLLFTEAPVLQQFGLLSGLVLIFALITVLMILPVIVLILPIRKWNLEHKKKATSFKIKIPRLVKIIYGFIIISITIFAFTYVDDVSFNGEMTSLSFHPEELKNKEEIITGKNADTDQQIFLIHKGKTQSLALENAESNIATIENLENKKLIKNVNYISRYQYSKQYEEQKIKDWKLFWNQHQNQIDTALNLAIKQYDYQNTAYDQFKNWRDYKTDFSPITLQPEYPFYVEQNNHHYYLSSFVIDKSQLHILDDYEWGETMVFNRTAVSNELTKSIQDNFNFIAFLTAGLVIITLLIFYGRIELTLVTFLPMAISWIWILGICGFFGIEFNMVNIIIATFIFGLGDDFAVFLSDAAIEKNKLGVDNSKSFQKGIILSGITTIIGTGALIFANHPALFSIGLVSLIGMTSILILSLTIQPFLYKVLIFDRKKKGFEPWTLKSLSVTVFSFSYFFISCIFLNIALVILKLLFFIKKERRQYFLHNMLQKLCKSLVYIMFNNKKQLIDHQNLDFNTPSLIIANHQSFVDILVMLMFNPKTVILSTKWVYHSPIFGAMIRFLDFLPRDMSPRELTERMQALVDKGFSIAIFPEGTRSYTEDINEFKKGAFYFAEKLNLPITPMVFHGLHYCVSKGDFMLKDSTITIKTLPRIQQGDTKFGATYQEQRKLIQQYITEEYWNVHKNYELTKRLNYKKTINNYLYKDPIIEWYVKVKLKFQMPIINVLNNEITSQKSILDLGSGLGYFNIYLSHLQPNVTFEGWDYDEQKVKTANNCHDAISRHIFKYKNLKTIEIPKKDIYLLIDVLHYLPEEKQIELLSKIKQQMQAGSILFIREGFIDNQSKHKQTEKTEKWSTELVKFNKIEDKLCFLELKTLYTFAETNNLDIKILDTTKKNSNTLLKLTLK